MPPKPERVDRLKLSRFFRQIRAWFNENENCQHGQIEHEGAFTLDAKRREATKVLCHRQLAKGFNRSLTSRAVAQLHLDHRRKREEQ